MGNQVTRCGRAQQGDPYNGPTSRLCHAPPICLLPPRYPSLRTFDTSPTLSLYHKSLAMKFFAPVAVIAAGVSAVVAQGDMSICDKYTTALLMNNTAENQATVLTLVVNTALIGNYTNPAGPAMNAVTGILNNGTYMGTDVSLLKVSAMCRHDAP